MKSLLKKLTVLSTIFLFLLVACEKEDEEVTLTAEDAKTEVRAASQDVMLTAYGVMETPAVTTMEFMMGLAGFNDFGPTLKSGLSEIEKFNLPAINQVLRDQAVPLKATVSGIEPDSKGVYAYSYQLNDFELVNPGVNYLQMEFPADDAAYTAYDNNATLTVSDIQFIEITHTDEWGTWTESMLTRVLASLEINSNEVFTIDYQGAFNEDGIPTSMDLDMNMDPYTLTMELTGSGLNYTSSLMFKGGSDIIANYNLSFSLNPENDEPADISGFIQVTPLKFEGNIDFAAMDICGESIDCINDNVDVTIKQTEMNQIIGHLEARLRDDGRSPEPEPAIVYEDGSWEFLADIVDIEF